MQATVAGWRSASLVPVRHAEPTRQTLESGHDHGAIVTAQTGNGQMFCQWIVESHLCPSLHSGAC